MTNGIYGNEFQPPLRGLEIYWDAKPAVKTAGYFRMSLRDEACPPQAARGKTGTLPELQTADAVARNHPADGD